MTLMNVITLTFLPSDWLSNQLNAQGGPFVLKVGFSTRMGADHMEIDRLSSISGIWSATETNSGRIEQNRRFALVEASLEAFPRSDHRIDNFDYP